jgi:hypothetical protein
MGQFEIAAKNVTFIVDADDLNGAIDAVTVILEEYAYDWTTLVAKD